MTAHRKRCDDYFRFNPPQGLGDLDCAGYMNEATIIEITNVWLSSPDGKDLALAAYEKVKVRSTQSFNLFANSEKSAHEARRK